MQTDDLGIARTYAAVLLDLATEKGLVEQVMRELDQFQQVLDQMPSLEKVLSSPAIGRRDQVGLISQVVSGRVCDLTCRFLGSVAARGRMRLFRSMVQQYRRICDDRLGLLDVKVGLARQPDQAAKIGLQDRISGVLARPIRLTVRLDPDLIGGVVIHIRGLRIDNSIKGRLDRAIGFVRTGVKEAYHGL